MSGATIEDHMDVVVESEPDPVPKPRKSRGSSIISLKSLKSLALRQQWDKPIEFLLSCIAMSVGLGNIWRFPYVAYSNGGAAFLIPYLIVLFFIGKPLYFLEMVIGQFSSKGQVKVWNMCPLFKGVGLGSAFGSTCVMSFYCALMAITVFYFIKSFSTNLPWSLCNPDWDNVTCLDATTKTLNSTDISIPELYLKHDVLQQADSISEGIGYPDWRLALCLLFSWVVIYVSLIKGVKSAGKVAYFTALFPYVVLIILLIRGVTLEGAGNGIYYLFKPEWHLLLTGKVWTAAVSQCFFSLSVGFGTIVMFSSYNPFTHNVYRDAMIISLTDTFTSILAGCTIFAVLGNLAHISNVPVDKVATGGPALAFATYPQAIAQFGVVPQLFSVLFFLMLFTLGVGSLTSLVGGLVTIVQDQFPKWDKRVITPSICTFGFCVGLFYVTPGGQWILQLVDHFGATFLIYVMATLEIVGICWIYGLDNVCRDLEFMLEKQMCKRVSIYWKICWALIIPAVLFIVIILSLVEFGENGISLGGKPYPVGYLIFGWILCCFGIAIVPGCAIHAILKCEGATFKEKFKRSLKPTENWGPASLTKKREWEEYSQQRKAERAVNGGPFHVIMQRIRKDKFDLNGDAPSPSA